MLEFDNSGTDFRFRGATYYLEPLSLGDASRFGNLDGKGIADQVTAIVAVMADKARSRKSGFMLWLTGKPSPADAVMALPLAQQAELAKVWLSDAKGVTPGES